MLSFAAGATDAFAFLLLGGVFTANMTGNLVLAGLTERPGYPVMIVGLVVAILVFAGALYAGFRSVPPGAPPRRLVGLLTIGLIAQSAVFVTWILAPDHTSVVLMAALVGLSAAAMACQTAVARRIGTRAGVTTTYVTGTLTSLVGDLADRVPQEAGTRIGVIVALVAGALTSSLLIGVAPALGAALPVVPAAIGVVLLLVSLRSEHRHDTVG